MSSHFCCLTKTIRGVTARARTQSVGIKIRSEQRCTFLLSLCLCIFVLTSFSCLFGFLPLLFCTPLHSLHILTLYMPSVYMYLHGHML